MKHELAPNNTESVPFRALQITVGGPWCGTEGAGVEDVMITQEGASMGNKRVLPQLVLIVVRLR